MSKIQNVFYSKTEYRVPPVWIMRQAGRYLPEYQITRQKAGGFLNLCYTPTLAAEVTMQPITRFDLDAAIIFSDILVVADGLGIKVHFEENIGPIVQNINSEQELLGLKPCQEKLNKVYEAISLTRSLLSKDKSLIGFSGGPLTIASYIFSDVKKKDKFEKAILHSLGRSELLKKLIYIIAEKTSEHLISQIEAGCDVIQIFESCAGIVVPELFEEYIIEPTKYIINKVREKYPQTPIIGFPRESGFLYEEYIKQTQVNAVSIDYNVPLYKMKELQNIIPVQGNMHPLILFSNKEVIKEEVEKRKSLFGSKSYIFNLGHGILPQTPIQNVEYMLECLRN